MAHGATVDLQDETGRSALIIAIEVRSFARVRVLLNVGAQVDVVEKCHGRSPLMIASKHGDENVACIPALKWWGMHRFARQ